VTLHHRFVPPPRDDAPTLLLIHPMGASLSFWDACLPHWLPRAGILAPDLRCAGASPGGAAPSLATHAADLEALCAARGARRLVPVACAVGGMVAAAYAARHPDHVQAMVLANPTPRSTEAARDALFARAAAVRAGGMAAILPAAVERPFHEQPRGDRYDAYLGAFAAQDAEHYAQSVLGFATADARDVIPMIRCPTLLVPATHDLLLPAPLAADFAALMRPGLAHVALDTEGAHFLPYQRPAHFAARVLDFLNARGA
jgi:3-oxoadipate enol-lactonase